MRRGPAERRLRKEGRKKGEREEGEQEKKEEGECLERRGVISGHDVIKPVTVGKEKKKDEKMYKRSYNKKSGY